MKPYPDYVCEHWIYEGENQPIGRILCSKRNQSVMLPISDAFVGLGAKKPVYTMRWKRRGPMLGALNQTPSEWDSMSLSEGRLLG